METLIHLAGSLHPPLVHFSVACPILAVLALGVFLKTRTAWLPEAAAWLWILTFLSALASGLTGHLFSLSLGLEDRLTLIPSGDILNGLLRDHVLWASAATLASFAALAAGVRTLRKRPWPLSFQLVLGLACAVLFGLTGQHGGEMVYGSSEEAARSGAVLGPLDQASGYREKLVRMNSKTWNSRTHGHRWVNTFVSKEAVAAYRASRSLPEGTVVVKESFEDQRGKPSPVPGPLYVMVKSEGAAAANGWLYALSWDKPVKGNPEGIQMPVTWLPGNPHLGSCVKCHNHFKRDDFMGGIPDGFEK